MRYLVTVEYSGKRSYVVDAASVEGAKAQGRAQWVAGGDGEERGGENITQVVTRPTSPP